MVGATSVFEIACALDSTGEFEILSFSEKLASGLSCAVAFFLVQWAMRSLGDFLLESSFDGVFLEECIRRFEKLGDFSENVFGVELNPNSYSNVVNRLVGCSDLQKDRLISWAIFSRLSLMIFRLTWWSVTLRLSGTSDFPGKTADWRWSELRLIMYSSWLLRALRPHF